MDENLLKRKSENQNNSNSKKAKNNDNDTKNYWCKELGMRLIGSYKVSVGDIVVSQGCTCRTCGKMRNFDPFVVYKDEEFTCESCLSKL